MGPYGVWIALGTVRAPAEESWAETSQISHLLVTLISQIFIECILCARLCWGILTAHSGMEAATEQGKFVDFVRLSTGALQLRMGFHPADAIES